MTKLSCCVVVLVVVVDVSIVVSVVVVVVVVEVVVVARSVKSVAGGIGGKISIEYPGFGSVSDIKNNLDPFATTSVSKLRI